KGLAIFVVSISISNKTDSTSGCPEPSSANESASALIVVAEKNEFIEIKSPIFCLTDVDGGVLDTAGIGTFAVLKPNENPDPNEETTSTA
ncbi:unnamed protein product, partial [Rotaria sp. Silwood1]